MPRRYLLGNSRTCKSCHGAITSFLPHLVSLPLCYPREMAPTPHSTLFFISRNKGMMIRMKVRIKSPEISPPPGSPLCFTCVISCTSHNSLRSVVLLNLQMRKQKLKKKSYVTCLGSHRIKFPHLDPKYHGRFSLLLNEQFSRIFLMICN